MEVTGIVQYEQRGDILIGTVRLKTKDGGWINIGAALPIGPVFKEVKRAIKEGRISQQTVIAAIDPHLLEVGFGWGDIVEGAKSVAKKITKNRITTQISKIVNDPRIAAGIGLASAVYPPLGATYAAVRAGSMLLDKVNQSIPGAAERVAQITAGAKQGAPAHVAAHGLLKNLWSVKKYEPSPGVPYPAPGAPPYVAPPPRPMIQAVRAAPAVAPPPPVAPVPYRTPYGKADARGSYQDYLDWKYGPGRRRRREHRRPTRRAGGFWRRGIPGASADVSGWAWNVPYRGNFQAAIQPSPAKWMRALYGKGLTPPT